MEKKENFMQRNASSSSSLKWLIGDSIRTSGRLEPKIDQRTSTTSGSAMIFSLPLSLYGINRGKWRSSSLHLSTSEANVNKQQQRRYFCLCLMIHQLLGRTKEENKMSFRYALPYPNESTHSNTFRVSLFHFWPLQRHINNRNLCLRHLIRIRKSRTQKLRPNLLQLVWIPSPIPSECIPDRMTHLFRHRHRRMFDTELVISPAARAITVEKCTIRVWVSCHEILVIQQKNDHSFFYSKNKIVYSSHWERCRITSTWCSGRNHLFKWFGYWRDFRLKSQRSISLICSLLHITSFSIVAYQEKLDQMRISRSKFYSGRERTLASIVTSSIGREKKRTVDTIDGHCTINA